MSANFHFKLLLSILFSVSYSCAALVETIAHNHTDRQKVYCGELLENSKPIHTYTHENNKILSNEDKVAFNQPASQSDKEKIAKAVFGGAWTDLTVRTNDDLLLNTGIAARICKNPYTLDEKGHVVVKNSALQNHYQILYWLDNLARDVVARIIISPSTIINEALLDNFRSYSRLYTFDGFAKGTIAEWLNDVRTAHAPGLETHLLSKQTSHGAARYNSIIIPSDAELMGVNVTRSDQHPAEFWSTYEKSWEDLYKLGGYTHQTLDNFRRGDPRGIMIVHSLEDIMGAAQCFVEMWNAEHPDDQRLLTTTTIDEFHQKFEDVFVSHYIPYVLARRYLISGSVMAFNDEPQFTLVQSFSPVSFIMCVPPQCIVCSKPEDAGTPVKYLLPGGWVHKESWEDYAAEKTLLWNKEKLDKIRSHYDLGAMLRCALTNPFSREDEFEFLMNEVAFLSCVKNESGEEYRPEIVGILINNNVITSNQIDRENHSRNKLYVSLAKEFAVRKGLPITHNEQQFTFNQAQAVQMLRERINDTEGFINCLIKKAPEHTQVKDEFTTWCAQEETTKGRPLNEAEKQRYIDVMLPTLPAELAYKTIKHYHQWGLYQAIEVSINLTPEMLTTYGVKRV